MEKLNGDTENSIVSKVVEKGEVPRFEKILYDFGELNTEGQNRILQYAQDLIYTNRYSRQQNLKLIARGGSIIEVSEDMKQVILDAIEKAKKTPS